MITEDKRFIDIQGILAMSDVHPADCIKINDLIIELSKENQELKKQLEELNKMIEKCGFVNIEQVMLNYCGLLTQQKEFIKWLEDEIEKATTNPYTKLSEYGMNRIHIYKEILQKYKEIIGDDK